MDTTTDDRQAGATSRRDRFEREIESIGHRTSRGDRHIVRAGATAMVRLIFEQQRGESET